MNITPELQAQIDKNEEAQAQWLGCGYNAAIERIADFTADEDNPYWGGGDFCVIPGDRFVFDEYGGATAPDDVRQMAFDLLVLADLAEMQEATSDAVQ